MLTINEVMRLAIVKAYEEFAVPADRLVCDGMLARRFAAAVNRDLDPADQRGVTWINLAVLRLRKGGRLPRLGPSAGSWPQPDAQG
jgi:hypothetical protein